MWVKLVLFLLAAPLLAVLWSAWLKPPLAAAFVGQPSAGSLFSLLAAPRAADIERGVSFGDDPRHRLDIYRPFNSAEPGPDLPLRPIVIFVYGGGWDSGDRKIYGFAGAALAARGYTTVIPDYRLHPEAAFPDFVADVALAYGWVADRLAKPELGPQRPIVLIGHSAGAHTAALLAYDRRWLDRVGASAARPAAMIGLAGPYAFDPTTWPSTKEMFASAIDKPDAARPVTFVDPLAPPTLIIHGTADDIVKRYNATDLRAALLANGVPVELIEPRDVSHVGLVLTLSRPFSWRAETLAQIDRFIATHIPDQLAGHQPQPAHASLLAPAVNPAGSSQTPRR